MGGAHTAVARDFSGVYYNPASLTEIRNSGFGFTGSWVQPELGFTFDRPESEAQALLPEAAPGVAFGAQFLVGEAGRPGRVGLGLGIHVPTRSLLSGQALDPETPHFYIHQSLPRRIVAGLGLAWAPWEFISIGASVQILAGLTGRLSYELDLVAGRFAHKSVLFDIEPKSAPSLGLELRPLPGLRLGAAFRTSLDGQVSLPVDLEVTGLANLLVTTDFPFQYMPPELAFGVSYAVEPTGTLVAVDLVWQGWSAAPDPSVRSAIDAGGQLLEGTGLDGAFDAPAPGQARTVDLGFRDVWMVAAGVEQSLGPAWLRGGYAFRPTPAPRQTSGTNYADGTAHVVALGAGLRFRDPLGLLQSPIVVDVSGSAWLLPNRRHEKIAANDPIGSFEAGGAVYSLSAGFRYEFGTAPVHEAARPAALGEKDPGDV